MAAHLAGDIKIRELSKEEAIPYDLLLLADPSAAAISSYIHTGEIVVAERDKGIIATYVLVKDKVSAEIKNIAVHSACQGQGIGKALLHDAAQRAKEKGCKNICIGTGNSSIGQLYLYQKQGFEMVEIRKDFFY